MKKILIVVLATASLLFAESYQVNTLSAKQMGMAHAGAGMKLGSESMHFNPGGLGFLDKKLDISAGVTFIIPEVEIWVDGVRTANTELGTPLYVYAASNITDWFSAGLSFTTPYGNTVDYGKDWAGADLLQSISLAVYALQPTVAFKFIDQVSFGGGPTINFGSFSLSKKLLPAGRLNGYNTLIESLAQTPFAPLTNDIAAIVNKYANSPAVSTEFSGDADIGVGFHVGALYDIIKDKFALGVSYRSKVDMKIAKGKAKITDAEDIPALNASIDRLNEIAQAATGQAVAPRVTLPDFEDGTFKAELPLPANLNTGVSFRPMDNLLLAFDWQWVFWSAYKKLSLDFTDNVVLGVNPSTGASIHSSVSEKKYHDTFAYRLGAQYTLIDRLDVRLGAYYDESPVDDDYLTPESPSTDKLGCTIGLSYRPISGLSIDASLLRAIAFWGRDATSGSNKEKSDGLNARYEVTAWVPSIGLNYSF
ncbi:MAG: outer membrane protein transport protein [Fibromonadales bacterium]|nr:outer membrane protein transport protein [Fibromonadales bacterium]